MCRLKYIFSFKEDTHIVNKHMKKMFNIAN